MRPKIICHMISSIDGRLHPDRWTDPVDGVDRDALLGCYEQVAEQFNADGWLVGRKTMEYYAKGESITVKAVTTDLRTNFVVDRGSRGVAITVDPQGKLHYKPDDAAKDHFITILSEQVSDQYLAELQQKNISYLFAGKDGKDLAKAMGTLGEEFAIKTILLEGGGLINGAFLKAGLIDEISLLIYPGIDSLAGVASIFEYTGKADEQPAQGQSLRHIASKDLDHGMVWLRYQVQKNNHSI